jgi:hypothetical protein
MMHVQSFISTELRRINDRLQSHGASAAGGRYVSPALAQTLGTDDRPRDLRPSAADPVSDGPAPPRDTFLHEKAARADCSPRSLPGTLRVGMRETGLVSSPTISRRTDRQRPRARFTVAAIVLANA